MTWRERERLFFWGSALAIGPALVFLPAFMVLIFSPRVSHARIYAWTLFPLLAVAEFAGVSKLARGCVAQPFNLLSWLSAGAMLVLLVIVIYTGVFLSALVVRM